MDSHFSDKKGGKRLDKDDFKAILRVLVTLRKWRNESLSSARAKEPNVSIAAVKARKTNEKPMKKPQ
jgi:hypothetical protein